MEAYEIFRQMLGKLNRDISNFIFKGVVLTQDPNEVKEAAIPERNKEETTSHRKDALSTNNHTGEAKPEPVRVGQKVGRNEPCPCGSGKKYKLCHGR